MKRVYWVGLVSLLCALFLFGCGDGSVYFSQSHFPSSGWASEDGLSFAVDGIDTGTVYDVDFVLEHGDDYPNANLYLYVDVLGPDGLGRSDTLHYRMSTDRGEWIGSGFAGEWELLLPYAVGVRFAQGGEYTMRVRHGMRYDTLRGIRSVALRVRESPSLKRDGEE